MANSFLSRWSQRKLEEQSEQQTEPEILPVDDEQAELSGAEDDVVLDEPSDSLESEPEVKTETETTVDTEEGELSISQLLANTEVDKVVKKAALRKLFMQPEFNVVDGLNDYDHDYSAVKPLATEVAETLRGWVKDIDEKLETEEESQEPTAMASSDTEHSAEGGESDASESATSASVENSRTEHQTNSNDETTSEINPDTKPT
ncbi:hypothetical protein JCM19240_2689 [Vibrio maritimus]|uniref:DUF3306 domain-containing protein n=1 Tax=Vibrio maritimus TaxID=990268 RepID=A0A090T9G9_9VIBR|nr:hypothetical protein JCM19240_2689 [Vibrio maritimus]